MLGIHGGSRCCRCFGFFFYCFLFVDAFAIECGYNVGPEKIAFEYYLLIISNIVTPVVVGGTIHSDSIHYAARTRICECVCVAKMNLVHRLTTNGYRT